MDFTQQTSHGRGASTSLKFYVKCRGCGAEYDQQGQPSCCGVCGSRRILTGAQTPEEAFWEAVDAAPADLYVGTFQVDWGRRQRGQGRRRGGMIMGAMSDAPRGVVSYPDILAKADLSDEDRTEAKLLDRQQQAMFARALAAGCTPATAFLVAYTVSDTGEPVSREQAYELISGGAS